MENLTDLPNPEKFMVGIGVRVVPAGVSLDESGRPKFVRASLILSPIAEPAAATNCGLKVDIRQWPERIEAILQKADAADSSEIKIKFSPIKAGNSPVPSDAAPIHAFRAAGYRQNELPSPTAWHDQRAKDIGHVGKLWRELVAPLDEVDWTAIIKALKGAGAESQLRNQKLIPEEGKPPAPPDIRGIGRGHVALLLSLERGRSLLSRVKFNVEGRPCDDRESECDLASPIATLRSYLTPDDRKKFLKEGPKKLKEQEKAAREVFNRLSAEAQRKRLDELDEEERKALEAYEKMDVDERREAAADREKPGRKARTETAQSRQNTVESIQKNNFAGDVDRDKIKKAYSDLLACATSENISECVRKANADAEALAEAIDGSVDLHKDATEADDILDDNDDKKPDLEKSYKATKEERAAQTRLAGLQHQPSLARLFNLVVDVWIPFGAFLQKATGPTGSDAFQERRGVEGKSRFGFFSAAFETCAGRLQVWTVCKVRLSDPDGASRNDVWACTRSEADLFATLSGSDGDIDIRDNLIAAGALSQVDGVVNVAVSREVNGLSEPRFDIVSLDAAQAVENRQTARTTVKPGGPPVVTLRTAGLALIDRWRETSALLSALKSLSRKPEANFQVIDAEDLTIGYRMDVAVKAAANQLSWRSLCNRWVTYGDDDAVEQFLRRVVPDEDRRDFDSAITVMSAKIQPSDDKRAVAYVEDTVGQWMGPPIGVDANSQDIDLTKEQNKLALQLSATSRLTPPSGELPGDLKIPRLLFGGGYFFGLTPRLHGGVIRPFDKGNVYNPLQVSHAELSDAEKHFAVLPSPTVGPRRFLRHERMEAPIVTTPLPILERVFDDVVDGVRQTANTIIVRTRAKDGTDTYTPVDHDKTGEIRTSLRVVFPPSVSAEFADRHGVFANDVAITRFPDPAKWKWEGPFGALTDVDYDEETGGFPVYGYSANNRGRIETAPDRLTKPTGDAVFRPRVPKSTRHEPYYSDPAASYVVIALRDLAGRMLKGEPLVVPVRPRNGGYADILPIAVEVVTKLTRGQHPASHDRMLGLQARAAKDKRLRGADVIRPGNKIQPDRFQIVAQDKHGNNRTIGATRVEVLLEPGESFEIDLWCLPADSKELARWFDAVESAALVTSVDSETGKGCTDCLTFESRLKALDLSDLSDFARRLGLSRLAANTQICTAGGKTVPHGALLCVADAAYDLLRSRPTPELAARTTIVAAHAIPQAATAPVINLGLSRVPAAAPEVADDPKQTVVVGGTVTVDRPTTGLIEIVATGASLVSNAFDDDQRRRRTADEVARGIWPRSPVTDELMNVRDVYGFDVKEGNRVELISEQATLLRIDDDLSYPGAPRQETRNLRDLQTSAATPPKNGNVVRVSAPFTISDSRARVLEVCAVAGSRTAGYFRDAKGDIRPEAMAGMRSKPQHLIVQATKAPAKVVPLTILPAFKFEPHPKLPLSVDRKVRLRVRMQRPWFSSGEGERLGIVLWPPDIMRRRIAPDGASAMRDYEVASKEAAEVAMKDFKDEDLGPGGSFVTRWGLDPIKGGGKLGWLIPPTAFPDLAEAKCDSGTSQEIVSDKDVVYVPRASVPIPVEDAGREKSRATLEAALLTFAPRFDIDHETWYCDIEICASLAPEPFMRLGLVRYQPYAPAELRVSEPVVEWVQIPQQRSVAITVNPKKPQQITVNVTGNGSLYSASGPENADPTEIESWTARSVMKISVLRRRPDGVEEVAQLDGATTPAGYTTRAERSWLPRTQDEWKNALALPSSTDKLREHFAVKPIQLGSDTQLSWCCDFELNDNPLKPKVMGTTFSVLVEEVQPMLPATYSDEPVGSATRPPDRESLTFSGPRFAALITLTDAEGAEKRTQGGEPKTPAAPAQPKPRRIRRVTPPIRRRLTNNTVSQPRD